jgi:hypothetical protein
MPLTKIPFQPGVVKDDTPLSAEGAWIDADKVRFVRGRAQVIGGWEYLTTRSFDGLCRNLHPWADNAGAWMVAIGTHTRLYAYCGGGLHDITPVGLGAGNQHGTGGAGYGTGAWSVGRYGEPSMATHFPRTWTLDHWGQNLVACPRGGALYEWNLATSGVLAPGRMFASAGTDVVTLASGGNTLTLSLVETVIGGAGTDVVTLGSAGGTVLVRGIERLTGGAGTDTVLLGTTGSTMAVSLIETLTGGAGTDVVTVSTTGTTLAVSLIETVIAGSTTLSPSTLGATIVVAGVDTITLGTAGSTTTVSLMASIVGGAGIDVVTLGSGGNTVVVSALDTIIGGAGTDVVLIATTGATMLVSLIESLTGGAGTDIITLGTAGSTMTVSLLERLTGGVGTDIVTIGSAGMTAMVAGVETLTGMATADVVYPADATRAQVIVGAPACAAGIFVTPERHLVAYGAHDGAAVDPMLVKWSDQENNTAWTATALNQAGDFRLSAGSRIVRGLASRGQNLLWTDAALYAMRYLADPQMVFSFQLLGTGCGLIGPNAVVEKDGAAYWLSSGGQFYAFRGGAPAALDCPVRAYVLDNLSTVQADKIVAGTNAAFGEVWWFYPDARDGLECSRYVTFNTVDGTWTVGTFDRSAWADAGVLPFPVATDSGGHIYYHERLNTANGGALDWSLESAPFDLGDGDTLMYVSAVVPDLQHLDGACALTLRSRLYPQGAETASAVGTITAGTTRMDARVTARQVALAFAGTGAPAFARLGDIRLDMHGTGARR